MTDLLADCTTLRFGGPAAQLLTHAESGDWDTITRTARHHRVPPLVIGGGSNLIAPNNCYPRTGDPHHHPGHPAPRGLW